VESLKGVHSKLDLDPIPVFKDGELVAYEVVLPSTDVTLLKGNQVLWKGSVFTLEDPAIFEMIGPGCAFYDEESFFLGKEFWFSLRSPVTLRNQKDQLTFANANDRLKAIGKVRISIPFATKKPGLVGRVTVCETVLTPNELENCQRIDNH